MRAELRANKAALAYLKLMHDKWYRSQDVFGDSENVALVRLVLIGWMDGRLADFTSLSYGLNVSRQQATRRCISMQALGWLEYKRSLGRVVVRPTDKLIEWVEVEIPKRLRFAIPRWQQIAAMVAASIVTQAVVPDPSTDAGG
jgi:hypothetical protein